MTSVADRIGIRSHGIAGATLATLDLARARIFSLVRLGFPLFVDAARKCAFGAGAGVVTVRLASVDEGSTLAGPSIDTGTITAKMRHFAIGKKHELLESLQTKPHQQSETEALCKLN